MSWLVSDSFFGDCSKCPEEENTSSSETGFAGLPVALMRMAA